ncbi:MAG TPA: molybdenum cofactor guanylyltransferase [Terracidiphilus sp.]|nr:molybdenum cofactor guanylyltransferase [Terracidiphilus sp.]
MNPGTAAGFVLAGGQSSRMGRDKALAAFAGRTLTESALGILRSAGIEPQIAGSRSDLAQFAPVIADHHAGQGPLSGICAALESTEATHAVLITVDQPLIPSSLIAYLLHHAQVTHCRITLASLCGEPQTFPAVLDRAALPSLQAELASGRRACWSAFRAAAGPDGISAVPVELLTQAGQTADPRQLPPVRWFLNANTPDELARIETLACATRIMARIP